MLAGVLLALTWASSNVAVERVTGRVALVRDGSMEVFAESSDTPIARWPIPVREVHLEGFAGDVVAFSFRLPGEHSPLRAAVGAEDGVARLIWPNPGIGTAFPGQSARLTSDGRGIQEFLPLDAGLREELGLAEEIPDGAGVVVTYAFADERVWALAAADFVQAEALSPGDALLVTASGDVLRARVGEGVLWRSPSVAAGRRLTDVDLQGGATAVVDGRGVEVLSLTGGRPLGSWRRAAVREAKLLGGGRLLVATGAGEVLVVALVEAEAEGVRPWGRALGVGEGGAASPCPASADPLACLHPVPGGVVLVTPGGWRRLTLLGRGGESPSDSRLPFHGPPAAPP